MRIRTRLVSLVLCLAVAAGGAVAREPKLETDEDKILYTVGLALARNLARLQISEQELALVQAGFADGVLGRDPQVPPQEFGPRIDAMLQERMTRLMELEKVEGAAFRARAAEEEGATTLESGLIYTELAAGSGPNPGPTDTVQLHYHGTLRTGKVFDSSVGRSEPATFAVNGVVPCFGEGVQQMKVGGKSKLVCPPELAYGDRGSPPFILPGATLVFEVELLGIVADNTPAPGSDIP